MRRTSTAVLIGITAIATVVPGFPGTTEAQIRPDHPVIFDDFVYKSEYSFLQPSTWTDLNGVPGKTERAWYRTGWAEGRMAATAHIRFDRNSQLRLETDAGHRYDWLDYSFPPMVMSGFQFRTGTWAARIRFDDISMGSTTNTPLTHAFWTISSYSACITDPRSSGCDRGDRRWTEFNHEWNNFFGAPERQFIANGGIVDGLVPNNNLVFMRNPRNPDSPDRSCLERTQGIEVEIDESERCMDSFVSEPGSDRFVDLLIGYDNRRLIFQAISSTNSVFPESGIQVLLEESVEVGRRPQPMVTMFSILGRTRAQCEKIDIADPRCWVQDTAGGMSIDWFFYTPAVDLDLEHIRQQVSWMEARRLYRVNTTGKRLEAPEKKSGITLTLESPFTNEAGEWVAIPSSRSTRYNSLRMQWSYRVRSDAQSPWSSWSPAVNRGFTFRPDIRYEDNFAVNVRVSASDWYDPTNRTAVSRCVTGFGVREEACHLPLAGYGLTSNYPNPFSRNTTLSFEIGAPGPVSLTVFDIIGRERAKLIDGYRDTGTHSVLWTPENLPGGTYFYRLRSGPLLRVGKMIYLPPGSP